jgi:hypothetical protein
MYRARVSGLIVIALLISSVAATAAGYGLGSKLSKVTLEDQFGARHTIDDRVQVIVLTRDMAGGDLVKAALGHNGKALLDKYRAVYVSDVSSMPSLVRQYLVLPKYKERTYPMLLDTQGEFSGHLPSRDKNATILFLDGLKIEAVEYVMSPSTFVPILKSPKRFATR